MKLDAFLLVCLLQTAEFAAAEKLVVHEWGTFTSLQDERGNTIGGINTDDEKLPSFVHDLLRGKDAQLRGSGNPWASKGIPGGTRDEITMRLETPVIYFHPPKDSPPT